MSDDTEREGAVTPNLHQAELAALTPARIALGRSGASLPTREVLRFGLAHAQARDAVHESFEAEAVAASLVGLGLETVQVASAARSREDYLRRPDLGRGLAPESRDALVERRGSFDLAIIVADGLSSTAVNRHAASFVATLLPHLQRRSRSLAPVVVASQARVALGDAAAHALGARMALVLVGERPGLSSPDSLGAYMTFAPRPGLTDAARNCVSNIRPGGLSFDTAAFKLGWLIDQAFARSLSGVDLKDESEISLAREVAPELLPGR